MEFKQWSKFYAILGENYDMKLYTQISFIYVHMQQKKNILRCVTSENISLLLKYFAQRATLAGQKLSKIKILIMAKSWNKEIVNNH